MTGRDDWTWEEWGRETVGWRLAIIARAAGRLPAPALTAAGQLLVLALKLPFLAIRGAHPWVKAAEPWGIMLAVIGLGLSLAAFWIDYIDRVEERTVRAWQLLTTPASGNSGKREALEYLNRRDGLWCQVDNCLLTFKEPTILSGIDVSVPERSDPERPGTGAFLAALQLPKAALPSANLEAAYLDRANLDGAYLVNSNLRWTYFVDASLVGATLWYANLQWANLESTDLREADLRGADLSTVQGLTQDQLNSATGDENTKIPEGLDRPRHWLK